MKKKSQRNLSIGLLLLVLLFACVVSHKFREGMENKVVEERLDIMDDKLDDIHEKVVGEGGQRINTGKYVIHEDGEYDDYFTLILTKKEGNEYSLRSTFEDEKDENFTIDLELFSDNSMLGKDVKTGDMITMVFDKSGEFFFFEKVFFVHVDYKKEFLEAEQEAMGNKDSVHHTNLIDYFDLKVYENEATEKRKLASEREKEMKKREKKRG